MRNLERKKMRNDGFHHANHLSAYMKPAAFAIPTSRANIKNVDNIPKTVVSVEFHPVLFAPVNIGIATLASMIEAIAMEIINDAISVWPFFPNKRITPVN